MFSPLQAILVAALPGIISGSYHANPLIRDPPGRPSPDPTHLVDLVSAACLKEARSAPCGQLDTCCTSDQQCRSGRCHEGSCAGCSSHAECSDSHFCFSPAPESESICLEQLPLGAVCSSTDACGSGVCCDHVCTASCDRVLPDGAHCTASNECQSGHCSPEQERCAPPPCPDGFTRCSGHCYLLVNEAVSSSDAHQGCLDRDAPLALPRSAEQNQCVLDTSGGADIWMAMNDNAYEGTFVPSDGRGDISYSNWTPGNPNNAGGNQNCLQMWNTHQRGGWDDDHCWNAKPYVCQTTVVGAAP